MLHMSEATTGTIPQFHRGDRMGKALSHAGIGMTEMGDYLGVTRATVSRWVNGQMRARPQTIVTLARALGISPKRLEAMTVAAWDAAHPDERVPA